MEKYIVTVDDLKTRWPELPAGSETTASTLLEDAVTIITAQKPAETKINPDLLVMVACQMVKRAMATSTLPEGVTSVSQTVGPFATQMGFTANSSALFVTKAEKKLLGLSTQRAASIDMLGGYPYATPSALNYRAINHGATYCD